MVTSSGRTPRPSVAADREALVDLAGRFAYAPRRGYERLGLDVAGPETIDRVTAALDDPDAVCVVDEAPGGGVAGFAAAVPHAWESEHFGFGVARLAPVLTRAEGHRRAEAVEGLLRRLQGAWAERGGRLLIATVDTDDQAGLVGAQRAGFLTLEATTTYLSDAEQEPADHHRPTSFEITTYGPDDLHDLASVDLTLLRAWADHAYERDHFHADPHLDPRASDGLYVRWLEKVFAGEWADWVVVSWRDGQAVGFMSWNRRPDLAERYGLDVSTPSLGAAVAPEGTGSLGPMTQVAASTRPLGTRFMEWTTQLGNIGVHRVFARQHNLALLETHLTLHGWADG